MSEPLPTVEEISAAVCKPAIVQWLREHGFSALRNEECGCSVEDFAPCSDGPFEDCHAAYWVKCLWTASSACDCDLTGSHCARDVNEPCAPSPQEVSE